MLFALVQIVYWVSVSTWFGGALFVGMMAPVIFRTVKEHDPYISKMALKANLEGQHGTLLSGAIVGNILRQLLPIELACAAGMLVGLAGHWSLTDTSGQNWLPPMLRSAMFLLLLGILVYRWRSLLPRVEGFREEYVAHIDEPDLANPAKEQFDRLHRESVFLLSVQIAILLGVILFSGTISPRGLQIQIPVN